MFIYVFLYYLRRLRNLKKILLVSTFRLPFDIYFVIHTTYMDDKYDTYPMSIMAPQRVSAGIAVYFKKGNLSYKTEGSGRSAKNKINFQLFNYFYCSSSTISMF